MMLHMLAARGGAAVAAGDTTGPTLSSAVGTKTGSTTATVGATTNEANGTMYVSVTTSGTPPSASALKAGTGAAYASSQAISSTGAKTFSATGLTASTTYYAHIIHTDAAANDSSIISSASFTTDAAGTIFVNQSFSGFTNTSTGSSVRSQLATAGATGVGATSFESVDMADSHCEIAAAPWDAGKKAVIIKLLANEDGTKFRYYLTSGTVQELWVKWVEYRSSGYDFATEKDWTFNSYDNTSTGHSGTLTQTYGGIGTDLGANTTGIDDCAYLKLNNQGAGSYPSGGGADVLSAAFVMSRATAYTFKIYLKINDQGVANAIERFYSNGTLVAERTGFTLSDTAAQSYIKSFQQGMAWTNGTQGDPAGTTWRYLTDLWIGDYDPDA